MNDRRVYLLLLRMTAYKMFLEYTDFHRRIMANIAVYLRLRSPCRNMFPLGRDFVYFNFLLLYTNLLILFTNLFIKKK